MLEFQLIQAPVTKPWKCATCPNVSVPMTDTFIDIDGYGRVYQCQDCARRSGRVHGFVKGKRQEELNAAAKDLTLKERENDALGESLAALQEELALSEKRVKQLLEENDFLTQRNRQLEDQRKVFAAQLAEV